MYVVFFSFYSINGNSGDVIGWLLSSMSSHSLYGSNCFIEGTFTYFVLFFDKK